MHYDGASRLLDALPDLVAWSRKCPEGRTRRSHEIRVLREKEWHPFFGARGTVVSEPCWHERRLLAE